MNAPQPHLLRQKEISVMKRSNGVFVVFKTKHELKCQFSGNTSPLLRFFEELFGVINDDLFLTLLKTPAEGCSMASQ